jgi:hypothetical protein
VWSEQGVGDQILYGSMLRTLRQEVDNMLVMVDARLLPLFERANPSINFCPQNVRVKGIDSQIPMGSIGKHFISDMSDIPHTVCERFLKADPERVKAIRGELDIKDTDFVVGLSWSSAAPKIGDHKSVDLRELDGLFGIPNIRVINLQYTNSFKQIYDYEVATGNRIEIVPSVENRDDLDGLGALIECCDAVVSVSNATAHLAGALGVRTLLLDGNKLWFWSHTDTNQKSLWYPSVTTYPRDHVHAPWTPQVTEVIEELKVIAFRKLFKKTMAEPEPDSTSDTEEPTIVFFHVGDDVSLPQAMVDSIRYHIPFAEIIMLTDRGTPTVHDLSNRIELQVDRSKLMIARLNAFAELGLNKPAMYVDSDMIFRASVDPKEMLGDKDILMCRRSFNRDALFNPNQRGLDFSEYYGKKMDEVYPFLACVTVTKNSESWVKMADMLRLFIPEKFQIWYGDQEALKYFSALGSSGFIDEREYACLPEYLHTNSFAKILHYKGDRKPK